MDDVPLPAAMTTYVIVLNWNGWTDTVECLESVFRMPQTRYKVVVCDNGSSDGSLDRIEEWARGERDFRPAVDSRYSRLFETPLARPMPFIRVTRHDVESAPPPDSPRLALVENGENLGFAAGNNVGLRYALAQPDCEYVWLLNNDTVVEPDALAAALGRAGAEPAPGLCGSTIRFYHDPCRVQAFGGARFFPWLGMSMNIGRLRGRFRQIPAEVVERKMDHVCGVAMLVSRPFLEKVGLLCEDYFLYYEEIDWAQRGAGLFALRYAPQSIVYHKAGASAGSSRSIRKRSPLSDHYLLGNRLKVTRRFFPRSLPGVYLTLLIEIVLRLTLLRASNARVAWSVLVNRSRWSEDVSAPDLVRGAIE